MARFLILINCLLFVHVAVADEAPAKSAPSVEDNIRAMDRDRDGMVTITEIRAYLETRNGKGYRHEVLDGMEAKAGGSSCASPFTRSFY